VNEQGQSAISQDEVGSARQVGNVPIERELQRTQQGFALLLGTGTRRMDGAHYLAAREF